MYDMMVVKAHKPTGNYNIAAAAYKEYRKEELIVGLDAVESAKARKQFALWLFVKEIALRRLKPMSRLACTGVVQSH
jgi:hypothetical protein